MYNVGYPASTSLKIGGYEVGQWKSMSSLVRTTR